jgi:hypothetical protein
MSIPTSRQTLIEWCLRRLGHPVITINVADEQIQDRVDEALQYFREFHGDGTIRDYYKHQVTQQDIDRQYIDLPDEVLQVVRVLTQPALANWGGMFSFTYQFFLNDFYRPGGIGLGGNISNYDITMQYLQLIDHFFNQEKSIRFNRYEDKLKINVNWETVEVDSYFIVECYRYLDPTQYPKLWNDIWLKSYLTALIKLQWGENLKKYSDVSLIGGVKLNADKIFEEALREKEELEKSVEEKWQTPADFMMG